MSRLAQHQNKQFAYKTLLLIGLLLAFIVLFFTVGFKILINGSLFINQIANSSSKQQSEKKGNELRNLIIDPPSSATNSASLLVSGTTVNFDLVEIYLNGEKVDETPVVSDEFNAEISGLEKGENSIYFIAKSKTSSDTRRSDQYSVTFKNDKPKLEITSPGDNSKTNKQDLTISGKTDKETYIRINGSPVVVDAQGGFSGFIKLSDGDNTITIVAEDIVGNAETKNIKVTYAKDD